MDDFYDVLNIPKRSTQSQIRQAYKALARKWHPDKHPPSSKHEAETKFKSITEAYEALSGGDIGTMFGVYNSGGGGGPNWQQQQQQKQKQKQKQNRSEEMPKVPRSVSSRRGSNDGYQNGHPKYEEMPKMPRSISSRRGSSNAYNYHLKSTTTSSPVTGSPATTTFFRRKPPPIERRLECTLEELFRGCKKQVRYTRDVVGKNGTIFVKEEVQTVKVKPGWKKGTKVTFEEKGDERPGSVPSDVAFLISEKEHPYFKRSGNDLMLKVEVPLVSALTGWNFSFRLLSGERMSCSFENDIIVPGYEKVIKGEGMPVASEKGVRGDLRIKFSIVFPKRLSEDQKREIKNVLKDCH